MKVSELCNQSYDMTEQGFEFSFTLEQTNNKLNNAMQEASSQILNITYDDITVQEEV